MATQSTHPPRVSYLPHDPGQFRLVDAFEINDYFIDDQLLSQAIDEDGDGNAERIVSFSYDEAGNRVADIVLEDQDDDGEWDLSQAIRFRFTGWGHLFR